MLDANTSNLVRYETAKLGYGDKIVFEGLDLTIKKGQITMLCGPNGCGKSTALKALRRLINAKSGTITFSDKAIDMFSNRELSREMAMLTQAPTAPGELTVAQLATMGRFSHRRYMSGLRANDRDAIEYALAACDLTKLAETALGELSGGQLQRAWLSMIIAQDAPVILLDEPTNHLDITHQIETLELVKKLNTEKLKTIIVVMHDLNLAARYSDHMIMFKDGSIFTEGAPSDVMREEFVNEIFSISSRILTDPVNGRPHCIAYPNTTPQTQTEN